VRKAMLALCGLEGEPRSGGSGFGRMAVLCLCALVATRAPAQERAKTGIVDNAKPAFTTFDAPGAGTGQFQGTSPSSINATGVITGTYSSADAVNAFVRAADGAITSFEAPGGIHTVSTVAMAINAGGTITGYYVSAVSQEGGVYYLAYGFVRAADGSFTTFDAPGAGTGGYPYHQGTYTLSINRAGTIAGYYVDANGVSHGFTGAAGGTITSFDPPGSAGTYGESINAAGAIAGYYVDAIGADHGFVRAADGTLTTFDAPGAATGAGHGTQAWSINAAGTIAGYYSDANGVDHGFVRAANGDITTFDAPGAAAGRGTFAVSINTGGTIAGYYYDAKSKAHGFVRAAGGAIATFGVPGAGSGGTSAASIDKAGAIAGSYFDANGAFHGFLLTP